MSERRDLSMAFNATDPQFLQLVATSFGTLLTTSPTPPPAPPSPPMAPSKSGKENRRRLQVRKCPDF